MSILPAVPLLMSIPWNFLQIINLLNDAIKMIEIVSTGYNCLRNVEMLNEYSC